MRQHPCMLPRELRWEEVAPPQNWLETADWPEPITDIQCKVHQKQYVKHCRNV